MAKPKLQQTLVDSTNVDSYVLSWKIIREIGDKITEGELILHNNVTTIIPFDQDNTFHTVEIWRGVSSATETKLFKGEIYKFEVDGAIIRCLIRDEMYKAVRAEITKSYDKNIDPEAGVISDMFIDMMTNFAGLTADSSSVEDSGTVKTIDKFICNHADVFERGKKLANLIDWQQYYNPITDKAHFEPLGTQTATTSLSTGPNGNIMVQPKWRYDKEQVTNKLTIIGGEDLVGTEETFNGDASTTQFTLTYTPESVRVEVGGVLQAGGNETTSGSFDYSVDKENKQINFEAGSTPGVGVGNVKVIYDRLVARPVLSRNDPSITEHGEYRKTSFASELKNVSDVQGYADNYISAYQGTFLSSSFPVTDLVDVFPGQTIQVTDGAAAVDRDFLVSRVEFVHPYRGDTVYVGEEVLRNQNWGQNASERIRRLEEEMGQNQDILIHVLDYSRVLPLGRRSMEVQKTVLDLDNSFVLGHPTAGVLGTSKLGRTVDSGPTTVKITQGNNTYREFVYDEDFNDSGNTTADFDTTNKYIDFTSGEIWTSSAISLGTTHTFATVTVGSETGSLTYEISGDGKSNWQEVTLGVRTSIINTNTTGFYVRITENAASTARVDRELAVTGQQVNPAVKIILEET